METKQVTPAQYAKWYGCTVQYIHKVLNQGGGNELPHVVRMLKFSRFYVLVVPKSLNKKTFKK